MLGLSSADHEESAPDAETKLISKLSCSLVGQDQTVKLVDHSLAQGIYGSTETVEKFACNYGLNDAFHDLIAGKDLRISGYDAEAKVRIVELPGHPFFIATLFVPQVISSPNKPHPLIVAYLRAALGG